MAAPAPLVLGPALSRDRAIRLMAEAFRAAGIDEPLREARIVLCAALELTAKDLILHGEALLNEQANSLETFANRRLNREPLARISGRREFYGLEFRLSDAALIPRPDTETLVDAVLDHARARGLDRRDITIADLGTGSGAILAALLNALPKAQGTGIDLSPQALETARENITRLCGAGRAEFHLGRWFDGLAGGFDIIVSNPPYIPSADIAALEPEVARHDPVLALDGGPDGLDAYRDLARQIPARLAPGGLVGLEIGIGQAEAVTGLLAMQGLVPVQLRPDLGGIARALILARPAGQAGER